MDLLTLTGAGILLLVVAVIALGFRSIVLGGHVEQLREEQRRYTYRLLIFWKVLMRRRCSDAEQEEAGLMTVEANEQK